MAFKSTDPRKKFCSAPRAANSSHMSWSEPLPIIAATMAGLLFGGAAFAGPPFLTDDPEPVDYKHSEFYVFSTYDKTKDGSQTAIPAFEYNYGVVPDTQLHIVIPFARSAPNDGPFEYGLGDIEVGVKYRFIQETETHPQVGIFPMAELDTGDADKGLGNGKTWWRLPVWLQKSWGGWTTYGGTGYVINRAVGQKDYPFAGWLLQNDVNEKLTLGGEIFGRSKDTVNGESTTLLNFGGYYKFTPDFNLLFSAGHSVTGETHTIAYLGLWWGWGGNEKEEKKAGAGPDQNNWSVSQRQ
jgi:Putative MetA-pathway of phenol degradation